MHDAEVQFTRNIALNEGPLQNQHFAFLTVTIEVVILCISTGLNQSPFNVMNRGKAPNNQI